MLFSPHTDRPHSSFSAHSSLPDYKEGWSTRQVWAYYMTERALLAQHVQDGDPQEVAQSQMNFYQKELKRITAQQQKDMALVHRSGDR